MMTVPPPVIAANRVLLMNSDRDELLRRRTPRRSRPPKPSTWRCGPKTPAPMYGYAASSAPASAWPRSSHRRIPPPQMPTTDQALAVTQAQADSRRANSAQTVAAITPQLASTTGRARSAGTGSGHYRADPWLQNWISGVRDGYLPRPTLVGFSPGFYNAS